MGHSSCDGFQQLKNACIQGVFELVARLKVRSVRFRMGCDSIQVLHHNSLSESSFASLGWLAGAAALMFVGHGIFLLDIIDSGTWVVSGKTAFWICVIPLLVIGLLDFRASLLFSIFATPLFFTPSVPHLFTQGLGDLFAFTALIGFLIVHRRQVFQLLYGRQVGLLLIPGVALASILFNLEGSKVFHWNQIKYEVAELAGLSLAVAYALLLASSVRCSKDLRILMAAVWIAVSISVIHGLVSFGMMSACMPDLKGTIVSRGGQLSGGFGNPNYYGSWLLVVLPLCLYRLSNPLDGVFKRSFFAIVFMAIMIFLLLTVSRAALLTLMLILFVWGVMCKSWLCRSKALVILLMLATFFPAAWNFRFEACSADSDRSLVDYIYQTNTLAYLSQEVAGNFFVGKTTEPLRVQVDTSGAQHPARMQLLLFAYEAWQSSPLLGVGPGNLSTMVRDRTGIGERAHNVAATVLAEQGAMGLLVWLALWSVLLWRVWYIGWGGASVRPRHPAYGKCLLLIFMSLTITSLFADQYRVTWLWQYVGLILSPFISGINYPLVHEQK